MVVSLSKAQILQSDDPIATYLRYEFDKNSEFLSVQYFMLNNDICFTCTTKSETLSWLPNDILVSDKGFRN